MSTMSSAVEATKEVAPESTKMLDQEEERLREKLKAKTTMKQRRDSTSSSHNGKTTTTTTRSRSPSPRPDRDRSRSRSSSRHSGRGSSRNGRPYRDERPPRSRGDGHYGHRGHTDDPSYRRNHRDYRGPPTPLGGPHRRDYDDRRYDSRGGLLDGPRGRHYYHDNRGLPPPPGGPYYGPPRVRGDDYDDFGRQRVPPLPPLRSRSRSPSRSRGNRSRRSRSPSSSSASSRSSRSRGRGRRQGRRSRSSSSSSRSSRSYSSDESSLHSTGSIERESAMTKDQRTVFVNQLVQRATEREVRAYFNSKGYRVNEVILLRDRRTNRHKGCAYVELRKLEYVQPCIAELNDQVPDFQRFPILIKGSEAEKNYAAVTTTTASVVATTTTTTTTVPQVAAVPTPTYPLDSFGNPIMAQKVYVGGLNPTVTHDHLLALFSPFGSLVSVQMQIDAIHQTSKGFAFLQFVDPRDANLAIQSMAGQSLAGQGLKTGWGNQVGGGNIVTSEEFPPDAATKTQAAYSILKQLNLGQAVAAMVPTIVGTTVGGAGTVRTVVAPQPGTVAEARATLAAAAASTVPQPAVPALLTPNMIMQPAATATAPLGDEAAKQIGNAEHPSRHILIHNMFDKDQETEPGWANEIKGEFESEATRFGVLERCVIMSKEAGGKIYASFVLLEGAKTCASTLAGRWFDKRQLRVEYVSENDVPKDE